MNLNPIRRVVSGRKARFNGESEGKKYDLDLVHLTDRIIIMGYPATGVAALYRNKRESARAFLESLGSPYLIVNLCPRYENEYAADEFSGVHRFPFPDHFPPPLSLIPIYVDAASKWMDQDEKNRLVIHCKAGKGRSGTFAICYLLSQPGLPSAPRVEAETVEAIDPRPVAGKADDTNLTMEEKLAYIFNFHTKRRMAPGTTSRGVSISSQRRWIGYWTRLLTDRDPRPLPDAPMRKVKLEYVRIVGQGPSGITKTLGGDRIAVQVFRYRDSIATSLREREVALKNGTPSPFDDDDWDDRNEDMVVRVGGFSEDGSATPISSTVSSGRNTRTPSPTSPRTPITPSSPVVGGNEIEGEVRVRTLLPATAYLSPSLKDAAPRTKEAAREQADEDGGIILNADREVQLKLLLGKSGRKHGALPAMAALGVLWFIPSFESTRETTPGGLSVLRIDAADIDFLKPQANIDSVEIGWSWVDEGEL